MRTLALAVVLATQVFRASADLVVLQVAVHGRGTGLVPDLPANAFRVYEDGVPQAITYFLSEDRPVAVGLVVDNSTSMREKRDHVIAAAEAFARSSNPGDALFTVNFNERVWFGLPPDRPFTSDRTELRSALESIIARGQTALYDAVAAGLDHVATSALEGHVLVILSDGGDNRSVRTLDDVMRRADRSSTVIYCIGAFDEFSSGDDRRTLERMASATGGLALFPKKPAELAGEFAVIAQEIRHRYTIGYEPTNRRRDGTYRKLRIAVADPRTGKPLEARTRAGYLAPGTLLPTLR